MAAYRPSVAASRMDPSDPRTWPPELIEQRNLALAWALGRRTDDAARAAFLAWRTPR